MGQRWTLGSLLFIASLMSVHNQSGDGGDWGSGSMPEFMLVSTSPPIPNMVRNNSARPETTESPKPLFHVFPESEANDCSVRFHTSQTLSRRLRAGREEVSYLKALQHGNQAVVENLIQFVGTEMGDQRYEEIVQENIAAIKEDHVNCKEVLEKAADELENQLEGDIHGPAGLQKIKEESLAFEGMLQTTADIANRLEIITRTLHMQLTEQLKKRMRGPG